MRKITVFCMAFVVANFLVGCGADNSQKEPIQQTSMEKKEDIQLAIITGNDVFVREGPSTEYKPLTTINKGVKVTVIDNFKNKQNNKFFILLPDSYKATDLETNTDIILHKGLALEYIDGSGGGATCMIKVDGKDKKVFLPTGFGSGSSDVVKHISSDNWYNVKLEDGKTGWVYGEFVRFINTENAANDNGNIDGIVNLSELLEADTIYGIHLNDNYDKAAEKFAKKGWRIAYAVGVNPGFFAKENDYGYKESILYSGKDSIAYYVETKNIDDLIKYKAMVEKTLNERFGVANNISIYNSNISEYNCGDKYMHIWYDDKGKSLSVGMISKKLADSNQIQHYMYLKPETM